MKDGRPAARGPKHLQRLSSPDDALLTFVERIKRHAPVFMTPANCAKGTGWMLISGDLARRERAGPLPSANPGVRSTKVVDPALQGALQAMTGKVIYLGPQPERAAVLRFARRVRLRRCAAQPLRGR